jgi:signal peptidase I
MDEKAKKDKKKHHPRDPAREVVETIVFVVVLVLLLKLFVTEAFVIPTGSMAETLYGYKKIVKCPKCGHEFPVNSHDEVEGNQQTGKKMRVYGFTCPNCRYMGTIDEVIPAPENGSGDRVLVLKPLFHIRQPRRGEVVVFKWPEKPQDKHVAQNYIKRAMAFGGETLAIYRGELFVTRSLDYPPDALDQFGNLAYPRPADPNDLWRGDPQRGPDYRYVNNDKATKWFESSRDAGFPLGTGGFEIVRKEEDQILADRRIVWDNDYQPDEFIKLAKQVRLMDKNGQERIWWTRWYAADAEGTWTTNDPAKPVVFGHDKPELHWIRYRHLAMPWRTQNEGGENPKTDFQALAMQPYRYIDNFLGYNAGRDLDPATNRVEERDKTNLDQRWVGDLILECKAKFAADSKVVLELSKGVNRFQATFAPDTVTLTRIGPGAAEFGSPSRPCKIGAGTHELRFANVDCRLWVWVDGKRIDFGTAGEYQPPTKDQEDKFQDMAVDASGREVPKFGVHAEGYTRVNDELAPASIGAQGSVTISNIKLHRDIYYTKQVLPEDHAKADIYYVHPGHYMCLGDNSAQSSDSRRWGLVPERLMLGKAVFVFYPLLPTNRIGFIK